VVDEVDASMLGVLRRAVPATTGNTRRLASLGPLLTGLQAASLVRMAPCSRPAVWGSSRCVEIR
jgi:hypothetical protein